MTPFNWVKWWKPWRRCPIHYYKREALKNGWSYWGRCELDKDHKTKHALERGMDIVEF